MPINNLLHILFAQFICVPMAFAIRCYECSTINSMDQTCTYYAGTTCGYGFFGCIKIATYDGGVDKMGNFIDDPMAVMSMVRGCQLVPLGGVDACQQQVILGYRIVTCYCYSDYCNGAIRRNTNNLNTNILVILFFGVISNQFLINIF